MDTTQTTARSTHDTCAYNRATVERLRQLVDDADRRPNPSWVHTNEIRAILRTPGKD